jgi:ferrous iron transport protein B
MMNIIKKAKTEKSCCQGAQTNSPEGLKKIAIVGNPNVGKSVMFNNLTGAYVVVSNYPGTTVEVSRGKGKIGAEEFEVIDTPGMYSFLPITEEERVARDILLNERPQAILHMVDAKNLERMLPFTLQLIEAGLPVILVLNMADELKNSGGNIDIGKLEALLDIPVILTVSTSGKGMDILRGRIEEYVRSKN